MSTFSFYAKSMLCPWVGLLVPPSRREVRPYFGPPSRSVGGPNFKRRKMARAFSNYWWRPNVIYVTSGLPMPVGFLRWAKSRGAKVILNQDGVYTPSWYGSDYERANERLRQIHDVSDYVIYQSRFCRDTARRYLKVPTAQESEVLYNAVDLKAFSPRSVSVNGEVLKILSAGYFYPSKHYMLHALLGAFRETMKEFPRIELLLAGQVESGRRHLSPAEFAAHLTDQYGLPRGSVRFLGRYRADQAPRIFRMSDVFVHLKNNDPCPSIVLEALASGLPVIYCRSGGTPELVGEAGIAIDHVLTPEQPDTAPPSTLIVQAIAQAIRERETLSERARRRAEQFSLEAWLARHRAIMHQVLHHA